MIITAQIGTFTQNTDDQPASVTRMPPTTGPHAVATPKIPDQTPSGEHRPADPCSIRSATSDPVFGATEHSSDPTPNPARPIRNSRLRPRRSAVGAGEHQ